jgi:uncharacterized membrane protein (UPF0127 family)
MGVVPLTACQSEKSFTIEEKSMAGLAQQRLTIHAGGKAHEFIVEVAATPEEQANGLMHRQSLEPGKGMIFPYDPPQPASFWMRNTYIPLDLVFIAPGGTVQRIEANAVPFSEDPLASDGPVEAVLELAGGRAAEIGLQPGDRIDWKP